MDASTRCPKRQAIERECHEPLERVLDHAGDTIGPECASRLNAGAREQPAKDVAILRRPGPDQDGPLLSPDIDMTDVGLLDELLWSAGQVANAP